MGIEYSLKVATADAGRVDGVLRRLPTAREQPPPYGGFDLGAGESPSGYPAAVVGPMDGGVYFIDFLTGTGLAHLGVVVDRLVSEFGAVTVTHCD